MYGRKKIEVKNETEKIVYFVQLLLMFKYGENHQLLKLNEEMDELGKEIIKYVTKYMREGQSFECTSERKKIVEEMADVELCLSQVKYIFGILDSELEKVKEQKIKRLGVRGVVDYSFLGLR